MPDSTVEPTATQLYNAVKADRYTRDPDNPILSIPEIASVLTARAEWIAEQPAPQPAEIARTAIEQAYRAGELAGYQRSLPRRVEAALDAPASPVPGTGFPRIRVPSPPASAAIFVERRDPDGGWSPVVRFVDLEAPRGTTAEYRMIPAPGDQPPLGPPWAEIGALRSRPDADRIECQNVTSGRWRPLSDPRWDDCVIDVPWRVAAGPQATPPDDAVRRILRRLKERIEFEAETRRGIELTESGRGALRMLTMLIENELSPTDPAEREALDSLRDVAVPTAGQEEPHA